MKKSIVFLFILSAVFQSLQAQVKTGIDVLAERDFDILQGKKVGLVTNPTGVDSRLRSTVDILHDAENVNLVALYGPEHGVRGNFSAGDKVESGRDAQTGLPVFSLYGKTRKPTPEMLKGVDVLVYDIQDIGCRSYTYISTLGLIMEAAAENNKEVVVLDRPNPLGGNRIEGALVEEGFVSFVSQFKIPYIYGLTCGELARLLNGEKMLENGLQCQLQVVPMKGWKRSMSFEQTGLEWVPTSPHIPHKNSPYYYAVSGIVGELSANLIGVGYTLPFQTFATPFSDAGALARKMNAFRLPGVIFRPIHFKPYYMAQKGEELSGVQVHITDFQKVNLTEIQFRFLEASHQLNPEKDFFELAPKRHRMFDLVCGTDKIRKKITENYRFDDIKELWNANVEQFRELSQKYHLYH